MFSVSGYGEDINWVKWDDAIEKALDEDKPIFLLIHKTWCHACRGNRLIEWIHSLTQDGNEYG